MFGAADRVLVSGRARVLAAKLLPWLERALAALVCWQLAGLAWGLFAPATTGVMLVPPRPAPVHAESRAALLGWFGGETREDAPAASGYSLLAVIAGKNGVAVLKGSDGKSVAVRAGDSVDSGNRLLAVEPLGATLEHDGSRLEVRFPRTETHSLFSSAGGAAPAMSAPRAAAPVPAAGVPAIRVTHGQMIAVMRGDNVAGWDKGLSNAPDGGIRVDRVAAQPFARLLQLKDGDVLKMVNQRPLARLADISLVFFHFGQSPSVDLELIRRGVSMTQHYEIQP
ncbi:MAG: hypothetical protein LBU43_12900 [Candidatus Accumulibacter sp.]|nr:hypothetical protein [Accumulibacter sp.]